MHQQPDNKFPRAFARLTCMTHTHRSIRAAAARAPALAIPAHLYIHIYRMRFIGCAYLDRVSITHPQAACYAAASPWRPALSTKLSRAACSLAALIPPRGEAESREWPACRLHPSPTLPRSAHQSRRHAQLSFPTQISRTQRH